MTATITTTIQCEYATGSGMLRRQPRVRCEAEAKYLARTQDENIVHIVCAEHLAHYMISGINHVVELDDEDLDLWGNDLWSQIIKMQDAQARIGDDDDEWERLHTIIQDSYRYLRMVVQPAPKPCRAECCNDY